MQPTPNSPVPPPIAQAPLPVEPLPYASPSGYGQDPSGCWQEGDRVVVFRGFEKAVRLPDRCVKCNQSTAGDLPWVKKMYWVNPVLYVLVISPLIFLIVWLCVRKPVELTAGLCAAHRKRHRDRVLAVWGIVVAGIVCFVAAFYFGTAPGFENGPLGTIFGLLAAVLIVASLVYAAVAVRVLQVRKIDGPHVWFSGAGREFLASLPST